MKLAPLFPASKVMGCPWQMVVSLPSSTLIGGARVTSASKVEVHPSGVVTATEYVPPLVATMVCATAPVLHR